jgi:DNA-binding CsgD family transcriptional regulator
MTVTRCKGLFSQQDWTRLKEDLSLPPRQAEIVQCVLDGMTDKQTAETLRISISTVRTHLRRLFTKFGSHDRVELILYMCGYLREYHRPDAAAPGSAASAPGAASPWAHKHLGQNTDLTR